MLCCDALRCQFLYLEVCSQNEERREEEIQKINESKNDKRLTAFEEEISRSLFGNDRPIREKPSWSANCQCSTGLVS